MGGTDNDESVDRVRRSDLNVGKLKHVHFDRTYAMVLIGALLVFWVSAAGLAWISYGKMKTAHLRDTLYRNGYVANGEVTKRSVNLDGVFVTYEFSVDGKSYYGHGRMKLRRDSVSQPGGQIPIRYLPEDPQDNLPIGVEVFSVRDTQPILLCLFFMALCVVVIFTYLRKRRFIRTGLVVEARVTGCAAYHKRFEIYYEFTTESNAAIEGSCITEDEYEIGSPISVIYRRTNPKKSERFPVAGFIIETSNSDRTSDSIICTQDTTTTPPDGL